MTRKTFRRVDTCAVPAVSVRVDVFALHAAPGAFRKVSREKLMRFAARWAEG